MMCGYACACHVCGKSAVCECKDYRVPGTGNRTVNTLGRMTCMRTSRCDKDEQKSQDMVCTIRRSRQCVHNQRVQARCWRASSEHLLSSPCPLAAQVTSIQMLNMSLDTTSMNLTNNDTFTVSSISPVTVNNNGTTSVTYTYTESYKAATTTIAEQTTTLGYDTSLMAELSTSITATAFEVIALEKVKVRTATHSLIGQTPWLGPSACG